jgi:hypothetical protein
MADGHGGRAPATLLVTKTRKALLVAALGSLVGIALVLSWLFSPKSGGAVATSIEVLGYATNTQGELCARVSLKNSGAVTIIYGAGAFSGGAPPIKGEAETARGRISFDGPHGGSGGPCWVLPGSNRVFTLPLPDTTSRWQITYTVRPATSPRERAFLALSEDNWWNRLHPASQTFVKLIPHAEAPPVLKHSELFVMPEATTTRSP